MTPLLLAILVGLPGWANDMNLRPKRARSLSFVEEGPVALVALPSRKPSSITITGPGTVELTLYGIIRTKRGRRVGPGAVRLSHNGEALADVNLAGSSMPIRVKGRPAWRMTAGQSIIIELREGRNAIVLQPDRAARSGFAMSAALTNRAAEANDPPAPNTSLNSPEEQVEEPPLIARGFEPELLSAVNAEPVPDLEPGFDLVGERPPSQSITGASGSGLFLRIPAGDGLNLSARGTGVLSFDFHAHRDPNRPETIEPAVLAVLVDDVLVETIAVDGPADPDLRAEGQDYQLSDRTRFQVTVPAGLHDVAVTLSDNASAGGSLRVRFEAADVIQVPIEDAPKPPEAPPLIVIRDEPEEESPSSSWLGFTLAGGASLSNSGSQLGATGIVEAFVMPADFDRIFGFGVSSGFQFVESSESVGDPRSAGRATSVTFTERALPALADLRFAFDFGNVALMFGAGGGGLLSSTETQALGGRASTGTEWVWALTGHAAFMIRAGDGWLTLRGQWVGSRLRDIGNLRDFDPGFSNVAFGYSFCSK